MIVWVKFFAAAKQRAGTQAARFSLAENACVRDLRAALVSEYPSLGELLPHCRIAVNCDFATDDLPLDEKQEIGVIPPVSGG
jgi:molybdopterin converting factor subunit 1